MRRCECGAEADGTRDAVGGGGGGGGGSEGRGCCLRVCLFRPFPPPTGASGFSWESCVFGFRGLFFFTAPPSPSPFSLATECTRARVGEGWKGGAGCDRLMIEGRERERPGWGKKGVLLSRSLLLLSCNNGGRSEERENSPAIRPLPPPKRPLLRREPFSRQLRREEGRGERKKRNRGGGRKRSHFVSHCFLLLRGKKRKNRLDGGREAIEGDERTEDVDDKGEPVAAIRMGKSEGGREPHSTRAPLLPLVSQQSCPNGFSPPLLLQPPSPFVVPSQTLSAPPPSPSSEAVASDA